MVVSFFYISINSTLRIVILSTQPSPFSSCQPNPRFRRLICFHKRKIRVSRQPTKGCPNTWRCFILRLFTLFTSVPLISILPSPHVLMYKTYLFFCIFPRHLLRLIRVPHKLQNILIKLWSADNVSIS